jgi:UDP-2,4-diacetamido-2,4,6-trideoxy-beta-L-altropyranose hydrolase
MDKPKIIFRADGGPSIGMGHFVRTQALAEMLKDSFECIYATRTPTKDQKQEALQVCTAIIELPDDESHFDVFLNQLQGNEIVVLDNYFFSTDYQRQIKNKGSKLVCIDDIHDKHYLSDLVINHAPVSPEKFSLSSYSRLLLGFDYALLRKEFFQYEVPVKPSEKPFNHALLCFGGVDLNDLTIKNLIALVEIKNIEKISIVVGNAYQQIETLKTHIAANSSKKEIELHRGVNAENLIHLIDEVDFAVVPCSTILYEVLSRNKPVITGHYVDNQYEIAGGLQNRFSHILVLGDLNQRSIHAQDVELLEYRVKKYGTTPLISNHVTININKAFASLAKEFGIRIRKATKSDVDLYFHWVNEKAVREQSVHTAPIQYEEHCQWFHHKIQDENTILYLFEQNDQPIGQVRLDKEAEFLIVNYSVELSHRGKGLGSILLKMALENAEKENLATSVKSIKAIVKENNAASANVFIKLNFEQTGTTTINNSVFQQFKKDRYSA